MTLKRGFKAHAERIAAAIRTELRLDSAKQVSPRGVAKIRGIEIVAGNKLIPMARFEELKKLQADAFSACTFTPSPGNTVIVYYPLHHENRQNSDLAHEIAHVLLDHRLSRLERLNGMSFFACDTEQEAEANWLAGCLLLPRDLLLRLLIDGFDEAGIAEQCHLSKQMVTYRINVTGIRRQLAATKRYQRG